MDPATILVLNEDKGFLKYGPPLEIPTTSLASEESTSSQDDSTLQDSNNECGPNQQEKDMSAYTENILNSVFPPKMWEEDGKQVMQTVSSLPATTEEVLSLGRHLDQALKCNGAKTAGICLIRRYFMDSCFDEVLRQEVIDCGERGLLLKRVREEIGNRLNAYKCLVEASMVHGMQKTLQVEDCNFENKTQIVELEKELEELKAKRVDLEDIIEQRRSRNKELETAAEVKRAEEIDAIRKTLSILEAYMEKLSLSDAPNKT